MLFSLRRVLFTNFTCNNETVRFHVYMINSIYFHLKTLIFITGILISFMGIVCYNIMLIQFCATIFILCYTDFSIILLSESEMIWDYHYIKTKEYCSDIKRGGWYIFFLINYGNISQWRIILFLSTEMLYFML